MTSLRSKIGALLVKPALKETLKAFSLDEYGGAPMLGLKGLVVKTHGSSKAVEVKILFCSALHSRSRESMRKSRKNNLRRLRKKEQIMEFEKLKK